MSSTRSDTMPVTSEGWVARLDPRFKIIATFAAAGAIALCREMPVLIWSLAAGLLLTLSARPQWVILGRRLMHLNAFMLLLWIILPWSLSEPSIPDNGNPYLSAEGIRLALTVTLKANAITLFFTILLCSIPLPELGPALHGLRCPSNLVCLFMLLIRYTDVLRDEHDRLRRAMQARGFIARWPSGRVLRAYGALTGMLLLRSMERSERILAAMNSRGFDGRFHGSTRFTIRPADSLFLLLIILQAALWLWFESKA